MNDEKLAAAVAAVTELVAATIASTEPGRFAIATRICGIAHQLTQEAATRADDLLPRDEMGPDQQAVVRPVMNGALWGQGDVAREAMGGMLPFIEQIAGTQTAQGERAEAETLAALISARGQLTGEQNEVIERRIAELVTRIAQRSEQHAHVVPPVVLRGHPAAENGHGLLGDPRAADAARAAGGEDPAPARAQDAVAWGALGHGG